MQPRHLQASLTPLSRGPGTLQPQRCSLSLSAHMEGGSDYLLLKQTEQHTIGTKKKADSILFYLLSFLALRREWLPFHYRRCGPQRPQTFSKRQLRLKGGASQKGKTYWTQPAHDIQPLPSGKPSAFHQIGYRVLQVGNHGEIFRTKISQSDSSANTPAPTQHSWSIKF